MAARPTAPGRAETARAGASPRPPPIAAQGIEKIPWAENPPHREEQQPAPEKPRLFSPGAIKDLFRKVAKAVITELAPSPQQRRKRREETKGGFMALARAVTKKLRRSMFDFMYAPSVYDPEQERADAEQVLRGQVEEWAQEDKQEHQQEHQNCGYASAAGFDPHP